jgi:hypothetical protein
MLGIRYLREQPDLAKSRLASHKAEYSQTIDAILADVAP